MAMLKALKLIPQNLKVVFLLLPIMDGNLKYFQVPRTCGTPSVSNIRLWSSAGVYSLSFPICSEEEEAVICINHILMIKIF